MEKGSRCFTTSFDDCTVSTPNVENGVKTDRYIVTDMIQWQQ